MNGSQDTFDFQKLFDLINTYTAQVVHDHAMKFTALISPIFYSLLVIYLIWKLYGHLTDSNHEMSYREILNTILIWGLIGSVVFSSSFYLNTLVPAISNVGDDIASKLSGGQDSSFSAIQKLYEQIIITAGHIEDGAYAEFSFYSPSSWLQALALVVPAVLLLVVGVFFIGASMLYIIISKIMLTILLTLGGMFIIMLFFGYTRNWGTQWLGQIFNYILLTISFPILFMLFEQILTGMNFGYNLDDPSKISALHAWTEFLLIFICAQAATQVPSLCSQLSGGVGISGLAGISSAMAGAMGTALGVGIAKKYIGLGAKKGTKALAGKAWDKAKSWRKNQIK